MLLAIPVEAMSKVSVGGNFVDEDDTVFNLYLFPLGIVVPR